VPDETKASVCKVQLSGEYDIARTAELRDALLGTHTDERELVADLSTVTFMDSTALRSLLEVRAELERRGATLRLINPGPTVVRLLDITGTGQILGLESPSDDVG
jgi:anti-sigma B factor antagonist